MAELMMMSIMSYPMEPERINMRAARPYSLIHDTLT